MADPDRFDADPDPTFHADADPAPNPDPKYFLARENKKNLSSKSSTFFLHNLTKLVTCNFLCNNTERGARGEG